MGRVKRRVTLLKQLEETDGQPVDHDVQMVAFVDDDFAISPVTGGGDSEASAMTWTEVNNEDLTITEYGVENAYYVYANSQSVDIHLPPATTENIGYKFHFYLYGQGGIYKLDIRPAPDSEDDINGQVVWSAVNNYNVLTVSPFEPEAYAIINQIGSWSPPD